MVWKVRGEVVSEFSLPKISETSSLLSSPKTKVRPELGVLGYVWSGGSPSFRTGSKIGSMSLRLTTT